MVEDLGWLMSLWQYAAVYLFPFVSLLSFKLKINTTQRDISKGMDLEVIIVWVDEC